MIKVQNLSNKHTLLEHHLPYIFDIAVKIINSTEDTLFPGILKKQGQAIVVIYN